PDAAREERVAQRSRAVAQGAFPKFSPSELCAISQACLAPSSGRRLRSSKTARQPHRPCSLSAVISPAPPLQIKKPSFTESSFMPVIRYQTSYFPKITPGMATAQKCQLRGFTPTAPRESTSHRAHARPKYLLLDMLLIVRSFLRDPALRSIWTISP